MRLNIIYNNEQNPYNAYNYNYCLINSVMAFMHMSVNKL